MTIYINEQMNWTIHILKLLTETLLYQTITMDTCPMDTITNSCTNTDIHKRGVLEQIVKPPL